MVASSLFAAVSICLMRFAESGPVVTWISSGFGVVVKDAWLMCRGAVGGMSGCL